MEVVGINHFVEIGEFLRNRFDLFFPRDLLLGLFALLLLFSARSLCFGFKALFGL